MEAKIDQLSNAVLVMQNMMTTTGYIQDKESEKAKQSKGKTKNIASTNSETMIYHDAVEKAVTYKRVDPEISFKEKDKNRDSTSSEDKIDTSDNLMEVEVDVNDRFIADCAAEAERQKLKGKGDNRTQGHHDSRDRQCAAKGVITEAERNRTRIFATPGTSSFNPFWLQQSSKSIKSAEVDENYLIIGAHIDPQIQQKILNHEYVDFSKLLPKGKICKEEDHCMELINRGGSTFFVPVSDHEGSVISSFGKWEQAFRVFSNIYTRIYPGKASELIQYNHIIFTAANMYAWENVYQYDKEFRMHLSNYPGRSWSIILQQAWAMCLKDRINRGEDSRNVVYGNKVKEICRRYNKGKCPNGFSCKYEHRCSVEYCGKFGHGAHICRKRKKNNNGQSGQTATTGVRNPQQESGAK